MSVVRCDRCGLMIDMDFNCEVFTKNEIPSLDVPNDYTWVCFECLTDEEAEGLE